MSRLTNTRAARKQHDDEALTQALKDSFPASDPPSLTQPDRRPRESPPRNTPRKQGD